MTISITALRALLAAGTPGPWKVHDSHGLNVGAARTMVADMSPAMTTHPWEGRHQDAALIVAAHEALPELVDEVERLRAVIEQSKSTFVPAHLTLDMAKVSKLASEVARLRALVEEACEHGENSEWTTQHPQIRTALLARLAAIRAEAKGAK